MLAQKKASQLVYRAAATGGPGEAQGALQQAG